MATDDDVVVLCTYAKRAPALVLVEAFRRKKIEAAAVPSTQMIGAWDVVAPAHAAIPSREGLATLLARD